MGLQERPHHGAARPGGSATGELTERASADRQTCYGLRASTRDLPAGFVEEQAYLLERSEQPDTALLFECQVGDHSLLTSDPGCEGLQPLGPVGWIHDSPGVDRVELFRCYVPSTGDHLVSPDSGCEGQTLGFALPG